MAGLEEFQRAILLTFDPGADPTQRREANASLDALKQAAEGWRFCFQAFGASDVAHVKFWCLQTLVSLVSERSGERYVALPEPHKEEFRTNLVAWVQVRGDAHTTRARAARSRPTRALPPAARHAPPCSLATRAATPRPLLRPRPRPRPPQPLAPAPERFARSRHARFPTSPRAAHWRRLLRALTPRAAPRAG